MKTWRLPPPSPPPNCAGTVRPPMPMMPAMWWLRSWMSACADVEVHCDRSGHRWHHDALAALMVPACAVRGFQVGITAAVRSQGRHATGRPV